MEKHLIIHGRDVRITSQEQYGRMIIKAYDDGERKTLMVGSYEPNKGYSNEEHTTRFLSKLMEYLKGVPIPLLCMIQDMALV